MGAPGLTVSLLLWEECPRATASQGGRAPRLRRHACWCRMGLCVTAVRCQVSCPWAVASYRVLAHQEL